MNERVPQIKPDSVPVANKNLEAELPKSIAEEVIEFTAPVDEQATKDLKWEPPEDKQ